MYNLCQINHIKFKNIYRSRHPLLYLRFNNSYLDHFLCI